MPHYAHIGIKPLYALRNWLLVRLAGKSTVCINVHVTPKGIELNKITMNNAYFYNFINESLPYGIYFNKEGLTPGG